VEKTRKRKQKKKKEEKQERGKRDESHGLKTWGARAPPGGGGGGGLWGRKWPIYQEREITYRSNSPLCFRRAMEVGEKAERGGLGWVFKECEERSSMKKTN